MLNKARKITPARGLRAVGGINLGILRAVIHVKVNFVYTVIIISQNKLHFALRPLASAATSFIY